MQGIRVIEVAQYVYVPVATSVLAEWGADVIKVEHPTHGDAYRGLRRTGNLAIAGPVNYAIEHANRGKRSIGIDAANAEGRRILGELLKTADVLVTNLLPASRSRLHLEIDDVRGDNPSIIYARGTALGERGPERNRGGFDHATFWARGGSQFGATPADADRPSPMPSGAYGDSAAGLALAGGIAAALLARERTGKPPVVDLSLLGMGMWSMASAIAGALMQGESARPMDRIPPSNPLAGTYRSQDGRWIVLGCLQGFSQWPAFCRCVGRLEWIEDARFASAEAFAAHGTDCAGLLDALFASAPLRHWQETLSGLDAVWETVQDTLEVARDPQAIANGYLAQVEAADASTFELVASPIQFDECPPQPRRAPEAGQHTEEILLELGLDWDEINDLKAASAIN
ncbi:MAG: CoA transferase [Deltaproteobacteria bacterium]|nr:CoA transferase [Deltaproteobacteria bacterium]MBW2359969.1 CoA transferase [Deltaproteobacteria bacterium]